MIQIVSESTVFVSSAMNSVTKRMTGRPRRRMKDNIKTDHKEVRYAGVYWI
jgi:hypothetical protein